MSSLADRMDKAVKDFEQWPEWMKEQSGITFNRRPQPRPQGRLLSAAKRQGHNAKVVCYTPERLRPIWDALPDEDEMERSDDGA